MKNRRIVLYYGVVGDYSGAYDNIDPADFDKPENSLGYHEPQRPFDTGYTVVEIKENSNA